MSEKQLEAACFRCGKYLGPDYPQFCPRCGTDKKWVARNVSAFVSDDGHAYQRPLSANELANRLPHHHQAPSSS